VSRCFFQASGKCVRTHKALRVRDKTMATSDQTALEEQNRELRKMLAAFRVHSEEKKPGETLEEENRRLQEDLRWYQRVLKDA
jgi:hypothetical protein